MHVCIYTNTHTQYGLSRRLGRRPTTSLRAVCFFLSLTFTRIAAVELLYPSLASATFECGSL